MSDCANAAIGGVTPERRTSILAGTIAAARPLASFETALEAPL
jgi:hypothetical protein